MPRASARGKMREKGSRHNKQVVEMLKFLARKPRNVLKAISLRRSVDIFLGKISFVYLFGASRLCH